MPDAKLYDVFLSHNSEDGLPVRRLADCLKNDANLIVWLDDWNLRGGDAWQEEIEKALDSSKSCVVVIGPNGISRWHNAEMRAALQIRLSQEAFRVIPVLLPGANPELPMFLSGLMSVGFVDGDDFCKQQAFDQLVVSIRGESLPCVPTDDATTECPYRGLERFDEIHEKFFFGRQHVSLHLVARLKSTRFVALVGASGCGKSSVARAGLLPKLKAGALPRSQEWTYVIFRPGDHPLQELSLNLARLRPAEDQLAASRKLRESLQADDSALHGEVRLLLADGHKDSRLFILIDQFEEMFSCQDSLEQARFVGNIQYAANATGGQTVVLITMREDFVPRAAGQTKLAEMLSSQTFTLGAMAEADFRQVIEGPAALANLQFERGLVNRILADIGRASGALPLLEDTLLQLYQRRRNGLMTLESYDESGGVQRSLAIRADATFTALSEPMQVIARRVLLRLTQPGEGAEDTRRRAPLSELITHSGELASVEFVLSRLFDARLLTGYTEQGKELQIDVAHEALIRGWQRLRQWIEEERDALRMQRRLTQDAQQWNDWNDGKKDSLLYRDLKLEIARVWKSKHEQSISLTERKFLESGLRRERKQSRLKWSGILFAALLIIGFGWGLYWLRETEKSRRLAAEARAYLDRDRRESNYPIAFNNPTALNKAIDAVEAYETTEARDVLVKALERGFHVDLIHPQSVVSAAFSSDGRSVLTVGTNNTVRIWDVVKSFDSSSPFPPTLHRELSCLEPVKSAVLSNDGGLVLTISETNKGQVWDLPTGRMLHSNIAHDKPFTGSFSPDGTRVVTASDDQTVRVWEARTGRLLHVLEHNGSVLHAEFSSDGQYLLTVDGEAKLWDARSYSLKHRVSEFAAFAIFAPDAHAVVTIEGTGAVAAWDIDNGAQLSANEVQKRKVSALWRHLDDVSPDGRLVVEIEGGRPFLKDLNRLTLHQEIKIKEGPFDVQAISAAFSPDNRTIMIVLSDSSNRNVRLYECDLCGSFEELLSRAKQRLGRH